MAAIDPSEALAELDGTLTHVLRPHHVPDSTDTPIYIDIHGGALILGGGAIFAAWPPLYAVAFSSFYLAMLLLLAALILRPVGFKFRSKLENKTWRAVWDGALFIGGLVPALVFGVAFGNALLEAGRTEQAIAQLEEAVRSRPNYAPAFNSLGAAFFRAGRSREALAEFAAALRINPDFVEARQNLETVLTQVPIDK